MASPRIAILQERKEMLSEILRSTIGEYFELVNGSIQWKVNPAKVPTNGISKIKTVTKTDKFGTTVTTTSITLGNKIKAIHQLNKMEGLYRKRSKIQPNDLSQEGKPIFRIVYPKQICE